MGKIVFHSQDLDGHSSGAIILRKFPDYKLVPFDYKDKFPWDKFKSGEHVVMADVSLPIDQMIELDKKCFLTWIDHHKSIIDDAKKNGFDPEGIRDVDYSACELCWKYFFPDKKMPKSIHLLGRYDIWKWQNVQDCQEFQYGMQSYDINPNDKTWDSLFEDDHECDKIIQEGKAILRYKVHMDSLACKSYAFDLEFEGLRCIAMNSSLRGSGQFTDKWKSGKYDAMIKFTMLADQRWEVSMYSERKVDVSKICKKYGGGGHPGAAGFIIDKLPF